jgi:CBS domain-containing protein
VKKGITMKISEILTPNPQCISPETTLAKAAQKMKLLDVGMLPICDHDRLAGTVTDRDIVIRAIAAGADPKTTTVRAAMTQDIFFCFEDDDVEEAAQLMEQRQVRRLPVLNRHKRLVGIVSLGDLAVRTRRDEMVGEVLERVSEPAASAG